MNESKRAIYFWEDHVAKNLRESRIGRKGLSLFELKDMDIPVPEFFVVSSYVFDDLISKVLLKEGSRLLENGKNPEEDEVRKEILKTTFEFVIEDEIKSAYARISGFTDSWVSIRSSVVFPSNPEISFSGVFDTMLNVRGVNNVLDGIRYIYSSFFKDSVVSYAANNGVNLADAKISVVVQKMVQAEVSGVSFTVDPITQDPTKLSIEAVFGLGDAIALGELTPDTYLINKKELNILEKHISPQEWMKVRTLGGSSGVEKIKISSAWSHRQKLEDKYIKEISKIALIVESKSRQAQNIEWVLAGGRVWVLQSKDLYEKAPVSEVALVDSKKYDTLGEVIHLMEDKYKSLGDMESRTMSKAKSIVNNSKHEYSPLTEKLINMARHKQQEAKIENVDTNRDNYLLSGIGASFGTVTGKVILVDDTNIEVSKNNILVIKKDIPNLDTLVIKAGGIVMDQGGLTSDVSIMCREMNIPAVVGTGLASRVLKNGDLIKIDGNVGSIYKEKEVVKENNNSHPVVESYSKEDLSGIDLLNTKTEYVEKKDIDTNVVTNVQLTHDLTLPPCATKVFSLANLSFEEAIKYVGDSHGLVYIDMDKAMLEDGRHLLAYVEDKKFAEYSKDISEKICRYIDLAEGNQVILTIGSSRVSEFKKLTKGSQFENKELGDNVWGLGRYLNNKEYLNRVLKIVRRIRNVYKKRNVDLGIHSPMNGTYMKEFKKSILAAGLRRTSTFRVYAVLDNPSEVISADEIIDTNIDGFILNMPRIVRIMQGFDMDDTSSRYDLGINSAYKVVDAVVDISKKKQVIVIAENNKNLVKYCIQSGVYGISVFPQDIKDVRKLVSQEEAKLILSSK